MKTKNIFKTLALALLMPTMLLTAACSNSDDIVNTENPANTKGYALPVTINVTRQGDDAATRATYDGETRKLSFSTGDKLFIEDYQKFAGMLTMVSDGKFSGEILTKTPYTGTVEELFASASELTAYLLPAGYEEYGFLNIVNPDTYQAYLWYDNSKVFALTKKEAVEQLSFEKHWDYDTSIKGFELMPSTAILNFTISGLAANTAVSVSFEHTNYDDATPVDITTDASGVATFAAAMYNGDNFDDYSLTVGGNAITLPANKEVEAGYIYNISRSAAPVLSAATAEDIGKVVGADGKIYADVAAAKAASTTACAIIAYIGSETGEASPYNHGLAIAMKDAAAGNYVKWSPSENDESLTNFTNVNLAVTTAQSGLSNSQTSGFDNESNYPAFYAALHNTITTSDGISAAAPASGTSGWFLPSLYQWNKIVKGLSGQSADMSLFGSKDYYKASSLNTKIEAAGGTGLQSGDYWSSTEYDGSYACIFRAGGGNVGTSYKYVNGFVRSAFAF